MVSASAKLTCLNSSQPAWNRLPKVTRVFGRSLAHRQHDVAGNDNRRMGNQRIIASALKLPRFNGNYKVKEFSCLEQYLCMAFAQLTYRESLRDIESCLRAQKSKLYHIDRK